MSLAYCSQVSRDSGTHVPGCAGPPQWAHPLLVLSCALCFSWPTSKPTFWKVPFVSAHVMPPPT